MTIFLSQLFKFISIKKKKKLSGLSLHCYKKDEKTDVDLNLLLQFLSKIYIS